MHACPILSRQSVCLCACLPACLLTRLPAGPLATVSSTGTPPNALSVLLWARAHTILLVYMYYLCCCGCVHTLSSSPDVLSMLLWMRVHIICRPVCIICVVAGACTHCLHHPMCYLCCCGYVYTAFVGLYVLSVCCCGCVHTLSCRPSQEQVQDSLLEILQTRTAATGQLASLEETARACALKV